MGLYDTLEVQSPLLDEHLRGCSFQTKSLECGLDHYTITPDGRLVHTITVWEPVPDNERPYWGKPEWADPLYQACGAVKSVPLRSEDLHYHGDVYFYGHDAHKTFREFTARFTEGRLSWIREEKPLAPAASVVEPDAPPG